MSTVVTINASVVQGSVIGPADYIIGTSDLHPLHPQNRLKKYADDSYLLIGSQHKETGPAELRHISEWAASKNLRINSSKTREIVIVRSHSASLSEQPSITGMHRSTSIEILGVTIGEKLALTEHIDRTLGSCSSSLYALRTLRAHGLPTQALFQVARSTTVARLIYASPAWWGFTSGRDRERLERFMQRVVRAGLLPVNTPTVANLASEADDVLFNAILTDSEHVLRRLCPAHRATQYNLRTRPHPFVLPNKDDKNFIPRMMFKNIY